MKSASFNSLSQDSNEVPSSEEVRALKDHITKQAYEIVVFKRELEERIYKEIDLKCVIESGRDEIVHLQNQVVLLQQSIEELKPYQESALVLKSVEEAKNLELQILNNEIFEVKKELAITKNLLSDRTKEMEELKKENAHLKSTLATITSAASTATASTTPKSPVASAPATSTQTSSSFTKPSPSPSLATVSSSPAVSKSFVSGDTAIKSANPVQIEQSPASKPIVASPSLVSNTVSSSTTTSTSFPASSLVNNSSPSSPTVRQTALIPTTNSTPASPKVVAPQPESNTVPITSSPIMCEVVYPYDPEAEQDLELRVGQVIRLIAENESGWWTGYNTITQKTGIFPSNFVKKIPPGSNAIAQETAEQSMVQSIAEDQSFEDSKDRIILVKALFDYEARDFDEISFRAGEIVKVLRQNENGWWYGALNVPEAKPGLFPSNFVVNLLVEDTGSS